MTQYSRPVFDVDFAGLPDASSWPTEYFKQTIATTGASITVASGVGILNNGTVGAFGAQTQLRCWGYPIEGDKFEILAKVKIISTGNTSWIEFCYRSTNDPNDTGYRLNFSDTQYRFDRRVGFSSTTQTSATQSLAANTIVWVRMRVFGNRHMMRTWTDGTTEPQTWNLSYIEATNPQIGKIFINSGGSDGLNRQIGLISLSVREIGDPWEPVLTQFGTVNLSGTGAATSFTVAHGLDGTPTNVSLTPKNSLSWAQHWISAVSSTTFTITFTTAPASGTNNISFDWIASV